MKDKTVTQVSWSQDQATYCCGMEEVGGMSVEKVPVDGRYEWSGLVYTNEELLPDKALKQMREDAGLRPIMFNFMKPKGSRRFDAYQLRQEVLKQTDCIVVHRWENPGTNNTIECLILTNNSK